MDIYTLFKTCKNKDFLLEVLRQKPDLNKKINNIYGDTILMYVFENCNDKDILLEILKQKPDLNKKINNDGYTITMYAFKYCDDKDVLLEILRQKPDLNIQNNFKATATMYALTNCKHEEVLFEILKQKPNLKLGLIDEPVLLSAFKYCKIESVLLKLLELLLQDSSLRSLKIYGIPIYYVIFIECKNKKVSLEMLKYKKYFPHKNNLIVKFNYCKDKDVLLEILKLKPDLNYKNYDNNTVTIFAFIDCIDNEVLLELLKQKPNLTFVNNDNKTTLDYALEYYVKSPNFEFDVLEKLYDENCEQDKQLVNLDYIRIKRKYKVLPLILFRHQKRYGVKN